MKLKGTIVLMAASVVIVGVVIYVKEITTFIQGIDRFSKFYDYNLERHGSPRMKQPFIYLTQTEKCLPPNLATSSQIGDPETCNCDAIVLSWRAKCGEYNHSHVSYLFDPNAGWISGRNLLFFAAMERRPGYHYYIFLDDDAVLKYNEFTPVDMTKLSPWRVVEEWLLDYEPAVGVLHYNFHHGASVVLNRRQDLCGINDTSLVLPTVYFDSVFNAFHHKAVEHILPYPTQYEHLSWYGINIHVVATVEVKFPGQALLYAAVTAGNPKHRGYERTTRYLTNMSREFIEEIRQQAPPELRNHVLFKELHKSPRGYLEHSHTFCLNVTRQQPIIPYRYLLREG